MCHHEKNWLQNCPLDFKPLFYKRYIDDNFLLFTNEQHAHMFLQYFNNQHVNITFTLECETNNALSFLDVKVSRENNKFITSVIRKEIFTEQGTSFFSFCFHNFKLNSIKTLVHRAYNIISNYFLFHLELDFLKQYFFNNGYPRHILDTHIKKFLDNKFLRNSDVQNDRVTKFISLLYFGHKSVKMKGELSKLFIKYFPSLDFKIILVNSFTIGSLFKFKDSLPIVSRSPYARFADVGAQREESTYRCSFNCPCSFCYQRPLPTRVQCPCPSFQF